MPNVCSCAGCYSNKTGHPSKAAFRIPQGSDLKDRWLKFINRKDLTGEMKYVYVCELHFEEQYLNRTNSRLRLHNAKRPIPTIFSQQIQEKKPSLIPNLTTPRKPPKERIFRPDEKDSKAYKDLTIEKFEDIDEQLLKFLDKSYQFQRNEDNVVFYKIEVNKISVPKVTECIRIDTYRRVKLFYNDCPVPLPQWFREKSCLLTSATQLENFPPYMRAKNEKFSSSLAAELEQIRYNKLPAYSISISSSL